MTKRNNDDVMQLLKFADVSPQYKELARLYHDTFASSSGMQKFIAECGGAANAIEVLKINHAAS